MTKLTLEDVAADCDNRPVLYGLSSVAHLRYAALCRSAQAVIEAAVMPAGRFHTNECARVWVDTGYADESCVCGIKALREALAAHARNEQGTGEGV